MSVAGVMWSDLGLRWWDDLVAGAEVAEAGGGSGPEVVRTHIGSRGPGDRGRSGPGIQRWALIRINSWAMAPGGTEWSGAVLSLTRSCLSL